MKQLILSFFIAIIKRSARKYLAKTNPMIIWVTGSVGKTSCRLIVYNALKVLLPQEFIYTSPKNYNSDLGLSLSILGIDSYKPSIDGLLNSLFESLYQAFFIKTKPSILVLEYGIDKPGDMDFLLSIAVPDMSILTSIDLVHGEKFPDGIQGIYNEKIKLLCATKDTVFISSDLEKWWKGTSVEENLKTKTLVEFGEGVNQGQIWFSDYKISLSGSKITSSYIYEFGGNKLTITTNATGGFTIAYQCIGITIADIISHRKKYPSIWTQQALQLPIELQPGRFSLFTDTQGDIIVDSTYNASPSSMRKVITQSLDIQKQFFPHYKVICVLGEMRELGEQSLQEHQELGKWLADKVDIIIWVSGHSVAMTDYLISLHDPHKKIYWVQTSLEVSDIVRQIMKEQYTPIVQDVQVGEVAKTNFMIIFKSSQGEIRLEEAVKAFIPQEQWSALPRQEWYWLEKKQFEKKMYIIQN